MKSILQRKCLVLNKDWIPCNTVSIKRAVSIVLKNRGKILHPATLVPYTFSEWIEKGFERRENETLGYKSLKYDIPTIILAVFHDKLHIKYTTLNHENIYRRDDHTCVYCGSKGNLTWDHIVPECEGGKTSWTNLVTSCKDCNNRKDRMSVEEFCQIMNCDIPKPASLATTPWLIEESEIRPEWRFFLKGSK